MSGYKQHLFICTNSPDREGKCGSKGSEELRLALKQRCGKEFGKDVRVNASGCLGHCERGIAAVLYPQGEWFLDLAKEDQEVLFRAVQEKIK
ncbi:MAG: 2Fe-2S ferredoxin [Bdellovibrio sp. CG10_big_fil_rev_8_21_14_0_10_47_8]|nr:MAG: 2Fe-2S ferredoxin [Bdellovibrio sp. CG10_big_fil_rev_8_21_14_0_10_47_8]